MESEPTTWHHGVVARWWAEFNVSGPEIEYFRKFVEGGGQPALDLACGTGRLLVPYLRDGLDLDGCDISEDMLTLCRERAEAEGLSPHLYRQPMHRLDLPRRYRTILISGSFGLGGNRAHDVEALRRCYEHLEPGGKLILDNEVPYSRSDWRYWRKDERTRLPTAWRGEGKRRRGSDGSEYELRSRLVDLDPLTQRGTYQMHATMWRGGGLIAEEEHVLQMTLYFTHEIVLMLGQAGFASIDVRAGCSDAAPVAADDIVVFIAQKPDL